MAGWSDPGLLDEMTRTLHHRGPDDGGTRVFTSNLTEAGLGHRRLSIIDLSSSGRQPMSDESGRYWITFNGEIYNFQELRVDLEKRGHQFNSQTDTEVVVHLFEERGVDCIADLRGMFAFAIWDCHEEELTLVRDRLGVKPLFYAEDATGITFASEMKSLFHSGRVSKTLDKVSLDQYLTYLYVPPPRTIFEEVRKLPPGHFLKWKRGELNIEEYWDLKYEEHNYDPQEAIENVRQSVEEAVRLRMISDVPLGALLSGGIDSSVITGIMAHYSNDRVKTFSIGFGTGAELYDEREPARRVADHFSTEHHEIEADCNVVDLLPQMVCGFDEPFGNPTAMLVYVLSRALKEHVSVALGGDGGDEVFYGYPRYQAIRYADWYRRMPGWFRNNVVERSVALLPESTRGRHGLRRIKEFVEGAHLEPEQMYRAWVIYYNYAMRQELYGENMVSEKEEQETDFLLGHMARQRGLSLLDRAAYADLHSFLPCNVLHYADRMSMAHGLELRVPYTDHKLVESVASISQSMKIKGLTSKYILKEAFRDILPEFVLKRRKIGLNPPMGLWLQNDLSALIDDYLAPELIRRRGYFRYDTIARILAVHKAGKKDFALQIWALIVFEMWHQIYLD